ncbi:MAG: HAMP domain-containing histidine kinase [Clostridia bacterium]|nr:HAMP domain-containing histidine kinase [Clostridia bacterium]
MIGKLRRNLTALVLAGLLVISAGIVAAINWANWRSICRQAEASLLVLAEDGGERAFGRMAGKPPYSQVEGGAAQPPDGGAARGRGLFDHRLDGPGALMLSNCYTVRLDADGAVLSWTSDRAGNYDQSDIEALAAKAWSSGRESGRSDAQFYRLTRDDTGADLAVIDARMEVSGAMTVLRLTSLVALVAYAVLSVGAVWLIRRMVRPVAEAFEKQRQFVADASHELKTPLAVISANAEVLADEIGGNEALGYIRSEVRRSDALVKDLLALARMDSGREKPVMARFDLSRAALSVALPFETAVFEAGKRLETDIPEGVEATGNEEMLKQLLVILLSNALKYSDEGGTIRLTIAERGEKRILSVHNTGSPIPEEQQARIFDRFYRGDASHSSRVPGSGLGLAIARSIAEAHRGRLTVRSREGEGTTFTAVI